MAESALDRATQLLARLPGLGPRSAKRAILQLLKRRDSLMLPLAEALAAAAREIRTCETCGNLDVRNPCAICLDRARNSSALCVVTEVADLWALERAAAFRGRYHVLGGTLSALDGRGPEEIGLTALIARAEREPLSEVILALPGTLDGQITGHYIAERLASLSKEVDVTRLAQGIPLGGEITYLDDGTLTAAFRARRPAL
ncbi:MAG: recombination protein RecR [Rhodospirillales bacterium]|nr:recombination protein RecR [Rhodospirillales bacterium]